MKVTYIYHSSFAVELEKSILIFDYYGKGDLPERPAGKQVYFLNSHSHPDHFSKTIFNLREQSRIHGGDGRQTDLSCRRSELVALGRGGQGLEQQYGRQL